MRSRYLSFTHQPTPIQRAVARLPQRPSLAVQAVVRYIAVELDVLDQVLSKAKKSLQGEERETQLNQHILRAWGSPSSP